MAKRWYCVHTSPNKEALAAVEITRLGFSTFIPMFTVWKREGNREVPVTNKPLFPRYIFVELDMDRPLGVGRIKKSRGVSYLMCDMDGDPVAIPYRAMRAIRDRDDARQSDLKPKKIVSPYHKGQRVKVMSGPFEGFEAMIEGPAPRQRVQALLMIFGRETPVDFEVADLRDAG